MFGAALPRELVQLAAYIELTQGKLITHMVSVPGTRRGTAIEVKRLQLYTKCLNRTNNFNLNRKNL